MATIKIPEVINHSALKAALAVIRAEVEAGQEDAQNLSDWAAGLHQRLGGMGAELQGLNVDTTTLTNIATVEEAVGTQARAGHAYAAQADTSVQQAEVASRTAHRNHGAIDEAVKDAPAPMATNTFYNAE